MNNIVPHTYNFKRNHIFRKHEPQLVIALYYYNK